MANSKPPAGSAAQDSTSRYARTDEAARYLKVSRSTLYRLAARPGWPATIKAGPRIRLFDLTAIDAFMRGGQV